ncbi:MAG: DNA-binding protein [Chloroflexi bacterium]|nr:DNA-binding protein [Chloroflexota bacterium]
MAGRFWEAAPGRIWVGRLETGDDLVEEIERVCVEHDVRAAWVCAIGAVKHAAFAYYEQNDRRYLELESTGHHEITGFVGNVSMRDDLPFLHAHATFGDRSGAAVGGHLVRGCEVFVAEITIREMTGVELIRTPDEVTGLALW